MEIIVGKTAGFCYGVKNAVTKTIEQAKKVQNEHTNIYCLGELVHNRQVIEKLEELGIETIDDITKIDNDKYKSKVVIRAHGVPPKIYEQIQEKGYEQIDLTCPNVLAIHLLAKTFSKEGSYIFLIGQKDHPEVIGIYGNCINGNIIEKEEDILIALEDFKRSKSSHLAIISQTTFSLEKFQRFVEIIKQEIEKENINITIKNTICNATRLRQEETENLSKQVQYMIIIGGNNSSNTKKLYDISNKHCKHSICVETVKEIDIEEIKNIIKSEKNNEFKIGIMAGASTPKESIEAVKEMLEGNLR